MSVRLGRYEVVAKIAEGGMATIYLGNVGKVGKLVGDGDAGAGAPDSSRRGPLSSADSLPLSLPLRGERPVALKVIKDEFCVNREFVNMFLDEAKIVSRLAHPNVVQLIELGKEGHRLFIAMELLMGQSLWSVWDACRERNIRLRYDVVSWIGARVAEGLHHAHELRDAKGEFVNLVHRDVNASNIFITYDGQVKVVDFGLAKAAGRISRTAAGIVKGKLAYMSPEQTVGRPLDRRTDVFALGATLWELTVDRRLFKGKDDVSTLTAVNQAKVPDPTKLVAEYPPELWKVLRQALERDKDKRFPTALEMGKALHECAHLEGRRVTPETIAEVMEALFENERRRMEAWVAASVPSEGPSQFDKSRSSRRVEPTRAPAASADSRIPQSTDTRVESRPPRAASELRGATTTSREPHPSHQSHQSHQPDLNGANLKGTSRPTRSKLKDDKSLPRTIAPRRVTRSVPPPGAFAPPAMRKSMTSTPDSAHDAHNTEESSMSSQVGASTVQRAMGDASCATFSLKLSYFDLDELAAVLVGLGAVAVAIATAAAILWDP